MTLIPGGDLPCCKFTFQVLIRLINIKNCICWNPPYCQAPVATSTENCSCKPLIFRRICSCHWYNWPSVTSQSEYWLKVCLVLPQHLVYVPHFYRAVLWRSDQLIWRIEMHSSHTVHMTLKTTSSFELYRWLSLKYTAWVWLVLMHLLNWLRLKHIHWRVAILLIDVYLVSASVYTISLVGILTHCELNLLWLILLMSVWLLVGQPFSTLELFKLLCNLSFARDANRLASNYRARPPLIIHVLDRGSLVLLRTCLILEWLSLNSVVICRVRQKFYSLKLLVINCVVWLKLLQSLHKIKIRR